MGAYLCFATRIIWLLVLEENRAAFETSSWEADDDTPHVLVQKLNQRTLCLGALRRE